MGRCKRLNHDKHWMRYYKRSHCKGCRYMRQSKSCNRSMSDSGRGQRDSPSIEGLLEQAKADHNKVSFLGLEKV